MNNASRIHSAIKQGISLDGAHIKLERGNYKTFIFGRISYESGGVWGYINANDGANISTTPFLLCEANTDVLEGDILIDAFGFSYQVGAVSTPTLQGFQVCLQAQLTRIE